MDLFGGCSYSTFVRLTKFGTFLLQGDFGRIRICGSRSLDGCTRQPLELCTVPSRSATGQNQTCVRSAPPRTRSHRERLPTPIAPIPRQTVFDDSCRPIYRVRRKHNPLRSIPSTFSAFTAFFAISSRRLCPTSPQGTSKFGTRRRRLAHGESSDLAGSNEKLIKFDFTSS